MRLQVFLAKSGVCSRRKAELYITQGLVSVNGRVIQTQGYVVTPEVDTVCFKGKKLSFSSENVYFLFNKPVKVESTHTKKTQHKTTLDYIRPYYKQHIFSVGRLDYMSSGLMLYTTDGKLALYLSHPRYKVKKTYIVKSKETIPEYMLKQWQDGIVVKSICYKLHSYNLQNNRVELCLEEGKNREIRTIFAAHRLSIVSLQRTRLGCFSLVNKGKTLQTGDVISAPADLVTQTLQNMKTVL